MRFNILPSHLRFTQTGLVLVSILTGLLSFASFSKAHTEPQKENPNKYELQVSQTQQREKVNVSPLSATNGEAQKREAWMEAGEYAKNHQVVAFSVSGHAKDATAEQIGEYLKAQLTSAGIPSIYFTGNKERLGAAVTFFLKDMAYGPTGISGIQKNLNTIAVHFPQAWPEYKTFGSTPTADKIK